MNRSVTCNFPRWMIVCDLDGTLLGRPEATVRFHDWWTSTKDRCVLVYASGRRYESVVASINESLLPPPDAIVADVGTEIRMFPEGVPLIEWSSRWWSTWQIENVSAAFDSCPDFELQPSDCQTPFKRSYFVRTPNRGWLSTAEIRSRERGLCADLIYSSNRDLDVLPAGANKGSAVEFLAKMWDVPPARVLVAGDSGNDLSMFVHGFRGIVVKNAQRELYEIKGVNVYHSPFSFADGVIDGLEYWVGQATARSHPSR